MSMSRQLSMSRRPSSPRPGGALPRRARAALAGLAVAACVIALVPALAHAVPTAKAAPASYRNPVTAGYSIDFPDPTILRGNDGKWYAYSTGGPYDETGATSDPLKIAVSTDLTHWTKVGAVFTKGVNWPTWADPGTGFWAPDIRYVGGHYLLYYAIPNTTASADGFDPGIGVATAESPAGPWTDSGAPVVAPTKRADGSWDPIIDGAQFVDTDGSRYLYYGSFGGIFVVQLSADAEHVITPARQVAGNRYEGTFVTRHGGWYYLMASVGSCCNGPSSGYEVVAGRARSPIGPFRDRDGNPLNASRAGGTIVLAQNGNKWVGPGHHALITDLAGQDYFAYHAIDRTHPYLDTSPGFTMRPLLVDRLDWIDGWPLVRGGAGPSDGTEAAPVTTGILDAGFGDPAGTAAAFTVRSGALTDTATDPTSDSGGFGRLNGPTVALSTRSTPADVHAEAGVRVPTGGGPIGLTVRYDSARDNVRAVVDPASRQLRVAVTRAGHTSTSTAALPPTTDLAVWNNLAVEVRGADLTAQLTDARQSDPVAVVTARLPAPLHSGRSGVVSGGTADVDNVSVAPLYTPHTAVAPEPTTGAALPAYSTEFTAGVDHGWTWKRPDAAAQVTGGQLVWPTERSDLSQTALADQTGLLLRTPPAGAWIAQTKLAINLGVDTVRNYQQAGLVIYAADDDFLRLDHVANGTMRFTEFGKGVVQDGVFSWGQGSLGVPADTTYFRIAHTVDPVTGEHRYRAASSTDGRNWTWGLTWTMPAGPQPRLGLVSQGSTADTEASYGKAIARFDYVRFYRG